MNKYKVLILSFLIVFFTELRQVSAQLSIVAGIRNGSYEQFANDIGKVCDSVKIRSSYGSVDNLNQLLANTKPFVTFLQYDVLINLKQKEEKSGKKRSEAIKILTPLPDEEIHLITRKESKINNFRGLRNKRVAVGSNRQGTFVTATLIQDLTGIKYQPVNIQYEEAIDSLLTGYIDALYFVGYAPSIALSQYSENANLKLLPIKSKKLEKVYIKTIIPAGTYKWQKKAVSTYSVPSVLATNLSETDPQDRYKILKLLKDIVDHYDILQKEGHRKWKQLDFDYSSIEWEIYNGAREIMKRP